MFQGGERLSLGYLLRTCFSRSETFVWLVLCAPSKYISVLFETFTEDSILNALYLASISYTRLDDFLLQTIAAVDNHQMLLNDNHHQYHTLPLHKND
jgi:hypothetical protein